MNKNQKIALTVIGTAYVAYNTVEYLKFRRQHIAKRAALIAHTEASIEAYNRAAEIMKQKIKNGEYSGVSLLQVQTDLEFYAMLEFDKK